ncbi:MAG: hypothetical protein ACR2QU_08540, partial [Gammaproteobacteria bacterium]
MNVSSDAPPVSYVSEAGLPIFNDVAYKASTSWSWLPAAGSDGGRGEGLFELQGRLADGSRAMLAQV